MKKQKIAGLVRSVERQGTSKYGNPFWRVVFEQADGRIVVGRTPYNGAISYAATNYEGEQCTASVYTTKAGNVYFENFVK